jgi:positive regulator of sigma E activity
LFSRLLVSPPQQFVLRSTLALVPGDRVLLQAAQPDIDRMAMLWYGLPLLLMLLTASLMQWALTLTLAQWPGRPWFDLAVLLALLGGLAAGWWLAARRSALTTAKVGIVRHCTEHAQPPTAAAAIEEPAAGTNIACKLSTENRLQ